MHPCETCHGTGTEEYWVEGDQAYHERTFTTCDGSGYPYSSDDKPLDEESGMTEFDMFDGCPMCGGPMSPGEGVSVDPKAAPVCPSCADEYCSLHGR